jgi:hypothetical protein
VQLHLLVLQLLFVLLGILWYVQIYSHLKEIGSIGIACDWMLVVIRIVWCLLSF